LVWAHPIERNVLRTWFTRNYLWPSKISKWITRNLGRKSI